MKKIILVCALAPLLAASLFMLYKRQINSGNELSNQLQHPKVPTQLPHSPQRRDALPTRKFDYEEAEARIAEERKKSDGRMAQIATLMTPEQEKKGMDNRMRNLKPRYTALFDTWGIDASTSDYILKLIRERDDNIHAFSNEALKAGQSGALDYVKRKANEEFLKGLEMTAALGKERYEELKHLEGEIYEELKAKAGKAHQESLARKKGQ